MCRCGRPPWVRIRHHLADSPAASSRPVTARSGFPLFCPSCDDEKARDARNSSGRRRHHPDGSPGALMVPATLRKSYATSALLQSWNHLLHTYPEIQKCLLPGTRQHGNPCIGTPTPTGIGMLAPNDAGVCVRGAFLRRGRVMHRARQFGVWC